jgi:hypothetical protein
MQLVVYKNAAAYQAGPRSYVDASVTRLLEAGVSTDVSVVQGDYLQIYGIESHAATLALSNDPVYNWVNITCQ